MYCNVKSRRVVEYFFHFFDLGILPDFRSVSIFVSFWFFLNR